MSFKDEWMHLIGFDLKNKSILSEEEFLMEQKLLTLKNEELF
jgi:hypothetical protein